MFLLLARLHKERFFRYFEKNSIAKIVIVLLFLVVLSFLALGVYASLKMGFRHIALDPFFREMLIFYVVELFLLVSFILVLASALITGIFSLFRGNGEIFLMASPEYDAKPAFVFVRMFFASLWPLLVIILPALLAIHHTFGLGSVGFFLSLVSVMVLVAFAVLSAIVLLLGIASVLHFLGRKRSSPLLTQRNLTWITVGAFLGMLAFVWERFRSVNLVEFFQARLLTKDVPDITPILEQFDMFPSHLPALTIFFSLRSELIEAFFYLFVLILHFLIGWIIFAVLRRAYLFMWQVSQEGVSGEKNASSPFIRLETAALARAETPLRAIFFKEYVTFMRNPRGMLWFGFILVIWGIQSASSFVLTHGLRGEPVSVSAFPPFVSMLAFAGILYFVAMFVLRFAFPSFSIERKRAWVIGSAPVDLSTVFMSKLFFFAQLFSLLAIIFSFFNASVRVLAPIELLIFFATVILAVFAITTYGLSLGAIFPNNETDDPEMLSTTLPGLAFIGGALLYSSVGAFGLQYLFKMDIAWPYAIFVLFSCLVIWALIRTSKRSLATREF